jgi:hypothetical protein
MLLVALVMAIEDESVPFRPEAFAFTWNRRWNSAFRVWYYKMIHSFFPERGLSGTRSRLTTESPRHGLFEWAHWFRVIGSFKRGMGAHPARCGRKLGEPGGRTGANVDQHDRRRA